MKLSFIKKLQFFQDLAESLRFGSVQADRRVQLKMPAAVVEELDKQFPNIDRSHLITQLAVDFITQKMKFEDRPVLTHMQASEDETLSDMWNYLEEREQLDNT
ncbi:MAG: hypothetical protein WAU07_01280 [Microgenomates group bacterium]